jgi:benzylsuccinate CoA-transferase BbsF subunit
MHFLSRAILEFTANGRAQGADANRDRFMAPHGVYPCKESDSWIAIACVNHQHWSALCSLMERTELLSDPRFATVQARLLNQSDLDPVMAEWTQRFDSVELEATLRSHQIPAAKVASSADMFADPQLSHRGHFVEVEHAKFGKVAVEGWPFKLSRTPGGPRRSSPILGCDNSYVLETLLGYTVDRVRGLLEQGILS